MNNISMSFYKHLFRGEFFHFKDLSFLKASFSFVISSAVLIPILLIIGKGGHQPCKECWIINTLVIPDNAIHFLLPKKLSNGDINTIDAKLSSKTLSVSHS